MLFKVLFKNNSEIIIKRVRPTKQVRTLILFMVLCLAIKHSVQDHEAMSLQTGGDKDK